MTPKTKTAPGQPKAPKRQKSKTQAPAPAVAATEKSQGGGLPPTNSKVPGGKLGALAALLQRPQGATLEQMTQATGWQRHSVRGALAGALKKAGYAIESTKTDAGRVYRICTPAAV